ncbi:unnamed protein product, partial [Symbiodinium sp. KB8]
RYQAPAARHPKWEPCAARCRTGAERVGGGSAEAGVFERTRGPSPGGRGIGTAPSSGGKRTFADALPFLRTTCFDRIDVRFISFGVDGPQLSYPGGPGWWRLARCSWRGYGDNWQGPTRSTRGVCRRDPLYAAEITSVSRGRAAASTTKAAYRPSDHHRQCPLRVACLAKAGAAGARWGHCLGRAGGMEIFGGFDSRPSPETPGQKESEESYGDRDDGYLFADPESSSRETAACAAAYAYHACRGQLGFLFGGIRSFGREPAGRRGRGGSYWGYSFLPRQRGVPLDSRGRFPGVWNTRVAAPGFSRSCCCSCGRKECRNNPRGHRYRSFGSSRIFGHSGWNSSGYSGDGAANSGGNRAEKPGKPGISYLPARPAGGEDAHGVGRFH